MVTKRKLMEEIKDLERRTLILEGRLEEIGKIALSKAEGPRKEEARKAPSQQSEQKTPQWARAMGDFKATHPFRPNQDKEG